MSRTPARFTQADVARSIRAAKQAGAKGVEIRPDGTIFIGLSASYEGEKSSREVEKTLEPNGRAIL